MQARLILLLSLAAVIISGCVKLTATAVDCDKLLDLGDRNECIFNKSINKLDTVSCTNIMNDTMKGDCINQIAIIMLDNYPCRQHDRMSRRDECERKVSEAKRKAKNANNAANTTPT